MIIFCTIVIGVGSVPKAAASGGKVGGLAMLYFMIMSTAAPGHFAAGFQSTAPTYSTASDWSSASSGS